MHTVYTATYMYVCMYMNMYVCMYMNSTVRNATIPWNLEFNLHYTHAWNGRGVGDPKHSMHVWLHNRFLRDGKEGSDFHMGGKSIVRLYSTGVIPRNEEQFPRSSCRQVSMDTLATIEFFNNMPLTQGS